MAIIHMNDYLYFWAWLVLRLRRPRIVGVTGSVGKTTTKEVIAAVLAHPGAHRIVGAVAKTPWNMNDNRGLPMAVLGYRDYSNTRAGLLATALGAPFRALAYATIRPYPRTLVLEYSASSNGDIGRLAALAPPTVGIVTTVGPAHLERFGTVERIAEEKAKLIRRVGPSGLVILGQDNLYTSAMDRLTTAPVVKVPGRGRALSDNIARIVGEFFGVPREAVEEAIGQVQQARGRLAVLQARGMTIIDDTFNANPLSMQLGLDTLSDVAVQGQRKVAVLGDMAELGLESSRYHAEIGAYARQRAEVVIAVGELARAYNADHWFDTGSACAAGLPTLLREGDCVYFKGSHAVHMDRVVTSLLG